MRSMTVGSIKVLVLCAAAPVVAAGCLVVFCVQALISRNSPVS
jgi:hypothetical protein